MSITPNRAVAFLTPLVFAPLAGAISVFVAKHFPGVDIPAGHVEAIFVAGAAIAFGKAGLWLKGWQEYERREANAHDDLLDDLALEPAATDGDQADEATLADGPDLDDEDLDGDDDLELELEGDDDMFAPVERS